MFGFNIYALILGHNLPVDSKTTTSNGNSLAISCLLLKVEGKMNFGEWIVYITLCLTVLGPEVLEGEKVGLLSLSCKPLT